MTKFKITFLRHDKIDHKWQITLEKIICENSCDVISRYTITFIGVTKLECIIWSLVDTN